MAPPRLLQPATLGDALTALGEQGAVPIAGGTWVMRSPIRQESWADSYVALAAIPELHGVEFAGHARIGACVTHAELARVAAGERWLHGLRRAAGDSANPAIRRMATIGGNLCTTGFPAADLGPALLCLDAEVVISGRDGERRLAAADLLADPRVALDGGVLRAVVFGRSERMTGHARLPLRRAGGDYPVAIVSVALDIGGGVIRAARVAVGSVEPRARRWPELETDLVGAQLDPPEAVARAKRTVDGWNARDDVDAPAWYRVRVLPALVGRAVADALTAGEVAAAP